MLKVYEWLVYIIMRPYKSFQHLINWFGIFIRAKTNYRKRKERLNKGEKEKNLPVARAKPAHPAQQAQRGTGVFFPVPRPEAARWNACSTPPTPPTSPRPP